MKSVSIEKTAAIKSSIHTTTILLSTKFSITSLLGEVTRCYGQSPPQRISPILCFTLISLQHFSTRMKPVIPTVSKGLEQYIATGTSFALSQCKAVNAFECFNMTTAKKAAVQQNIKSPALSQL